MRLSLRFALLAPFPLLGLVAAPAATAPAADPVKGKSLFTARCAVCHSVDPGVRRMGPSLAGVMGRKAGATPNFAYSPAMKTSKVVWNAQTLDSFLAKPGTVVPGNKMIFPGFPNPADRANVVAYLKAPK